MDLKTLGVALLATALLLFASSSPKAATSLTLTGPIGGNTVGPQSTSNPCIIAGTQCQQPAGFGFNNFVQGGVDHIDAFSSALFQSLADNVEGQAYTVGQIVNALGGATSFNINLDVNAAGAATDTLNLFRVRIDGNLAYEFDPGAPGLPGGVNVAAGISNNGNGFGDWTLGTVDLAGLDLNTPVIFFAAMTGLTDGAESFFITSAGPVSQVPIPGAMLLMAPVLGAAGGIGWWRKRRQRKVSYAA